MIQDRVRELFDYDAITGALRWQRNKGRAVAGSLAGYVTKDGHLRVKFDGREHMVHRVVWLWVTGKWPELEIDHRDGCGSNNAWGNLREVTASVNRQNQRRPRADSTLQMQGVKRHCNKFKARITVNGRQQYLGLFDSAADAHAAYLAAKRQLHEGCTL